MHEAVSPSFGFAASLFAELFPHVFFDARKLLGIVVFADPSRVGGVKHL